MDNNQPVSDQFTDKPRKHRGGIIGGTILIAVGAILLLQTYFPEINLRLMGPIILIVVGAWMLSSSYRK